MPGPAAPEMAMADQWSHCDTLSIRRLAIVYPSVARRSPAMTTPPANFMHTIVVPWGASSGAGPEPARGRFAPGSAFGLVRRSSSKKEGPGSVPGANVGSGWSITAREPTTSGARYPPRSLPAFLDVIANELLGVLLEDRIDLVEELVELLLDLLALGLGRVDLGGLRLPGLQ